jgi:hypothetical protein
MPSEKVSANAISVVVRADKTLVKNVIPQANLGVHSPIRTLQTPPDDQRHQPGR